MRRHKRASSAGTAPPRVWRRQISALAGLVGVLLIGATPTIAAAAAPEFLWKVPQDGKRGSEAGRLSNAQGAATDPSTGHVFVTEYLNKRVSEFTAWGEFVKAWGWGVANGAAELQTCGPGATPPTATCQEGIEGSGAGQFGGYTGGIATDGSGNIYVGDMENLRVQKFDSNGKFLLMFGGDVDKGPNHPGDVCTAAYIAEGDSCGAGTEGTGDSQFAQPNRFDNHIATGQGGTVFVGGVGRIQEFEPSGAFKTSVPLGGELAGQTVENLAVDDGGNFYLAASKDVVKLSPAGAPLATFAVKSPAAPSAVAVDGAGNLFVVATTSILFGSPRREVIEFAPDGAPIVPAGEGFEVREGQVGNPVEKGISLPGLATNTVTAGGGSDVYVVASSAEDVAFVSAYGPPPDKWAPPALPPEIKSQYAVSVDPEGAIVRAQIGPRFWKDTSYYVEYGIGRCSEGGCTSQRPAPPGNLLNAGIVNTIVNTTNVILPGLSPGTTYHYRFVAQSSGGGPVRGVGPEEAEGAFVTPAPPGAPNTDCPNQIFRTGAAAKLVDCRAYEMVSPVEKNNTDIASLINLNSNPATLNQSAAGGEALTYTTAKGFGDAQGAPYVSQYVASRGAGGWRNHGITPPQGLSTNDIGLRLDVDFRAFTPDLCQSVLLRGVDPALAPGAPEGLPEGFFNLYRRTNCGGDSYEALITAKPPTVKYFNPEVQGLSADGRCVIFYAEGQLTPDANPGVAPNGSNRQLYGFCDGQTRLISVLPAGSATTSDTAAGTANPGVRFRTGNDAQAVSADGSRVYWTAAKENPGTVYVRVNAERAQSEVSGGQCTEEEQACTIKVSQTVSGAKAHFWGATADGAKAFFTIEDQTSPLDGNLYEFDLDSRAATLVGTKVVGVMGVGGKAGGTARIYFASSNVLAAGATAGQPNLYLYERTEEGSQTSFIATLSTADLIGKETTSGLSPIKAVPYKKTSRVSPDGRSIAFSSSASLTGYDNVDVSNGEADAEVYTYNAVSGELRCASCNPTGQRPSGRDIESQGAPSGTWMAAQIPPYLNEFYGTRAISDDGSRVFFNSYDDLLPRDTNGKADVYEWERPGSGDCTEASSVFSPPNGGCLSLISSGESPTDSEFVDASADGTDVFFTTASSLLPQDPGLIDIYDARAGGGYPAPPTPPASCEGEACQGPLAPPNDPTPASSAFEGAGNVKAEKKAHKKKKTHKKKKSAKKNAAKKHKRANNKGRAGR